jgi:outer membrane receptor protein involved in Fe transport
MNRLGITSRIALFGSAAVLAVTVGSAANAQVPEEQAPSQEDQSATEQQGNQDIVVTAQKREERLQDVPISISVVDQEQILNSGASQLVDYAAYVPGFQVDNAGSPGRSTLSLRGVAPIGPSATVGIYLDDAPIGSSGIYNRSQTFTLDLLPYDIERLEVLRGPQGTLYGASSIGGLLKYVTVKPSLDNLSVRAGGELFDIAHGNGIGWGANFMVSAPVVKDQLAISASYSRRDTPGYVDNILTGERDVNDAVQKGGRLALLWQPDPNLTIQLTALKQTTESENFSIVYERPGNLPLAPGGSFLTTNSQLPEPFESEFSFYSGRIAYDFGFAELSSTTSYSKLDILETSDASRVFGVIWGGLAIFPATLLQKKWTEEIRLTSPSSDRFEWMAGFFYTDEDNKHNQIVRAFDAAGNIDPVFDPFAIVTLPNTYKEYAFFGNATYKFSPQFHLTGGLRWAKNEQTFTQTTEIPLLGLNIGGPGESEEDVFTFSISPQYNINKDAMVYARVASGYRPGGPNVALPGFPATVDSETVTSYEVGVKASLLDRLVSLDAAVYLLDWNDLIVGQAFANGINGLVNAGTARSKGVEAALFVYPAPGLTLGANFAYADAECTETTPNCTDGDRLPGIPKASGAITANWDFPLAGTTEGHLGGAFRIVGDRISAVESDPLSIPIDGYTSLDLNASVTFDRKWTVRGYVRNLFDKEGRITSNDATTNPGFISTVPLQPRTIGIAAEVSF